MSRANNNNCNNSNKRSRSAKSDSAGGSGGVFRNSTFNPRASASLFDNAPWWKPENFPKEVKKPVSTRKVSELECPICFEPFHPENAEHVPRLLSCAHSICTACLRKLAKQHGMVESPCI